MPHYPIQDLGWRYGKVTQPRESSLRRLARKALFVFFVAILAILVYAGIALYQIEVNKLPPPAITPLQRLHAKEIERRFSLSEVYLLSLRPSHLPVIQEITPAQKHRASAVDRKYDLHAYFRVIRLADGQVSYFKGERYFVK